MTGYSAYRKAQNVTESSRDIEYRLLAQVTGALIDANTPDTPLAKRFDVVLWNRNVWAVLREDLLDPRNQLPKELKLSLVSLSIWVEKETFTILDGQSELDSLIDVNKSIMEGLKPREQVAQPA